MYYRLNVVGIAIAPLRERREDIPPLVEHFVRLHNRELKRSFKGVDGTTMKILMSSTWKGNVRELDNVIEHAMIVGEGDWITAADLPRDDEGGLDHSDRTERRLARSAAVVREGAHPGGAFEGQSRQESGGGDLGVSLSSLYRKIEELEIGGPSRDAAPVESPLDRCDGFSVWRWRRPRAVRAVQTPRH